VWCAIGADDRRLACVSVVRSLVGAVPWATLAGLPCRSARGVSRALIYGCCTVSRKPDAASFKLAPCVVLVISITTPF
jgi:hypothetical protein